MQRPIKKTQLEGFFNKPQPARLTEEKKEVALPKNSELDSLLNELKALEDKIQIKVENGQMTPVSGSPEDFSKVNSLIEKVKQIVLTEVEQVSESNLSNEIATLQSKLNFMENKEGLRLPKIENQQDKVNWLRFAALKEKQLKNVFLADATKNSTADLASEIQFLETKLKYTVDEKGQRIPKIESEEDQFHWMRYMALVSAATEKNQKIIQKDAQQNVPRLMPQPVDNWYWTKQGIDTGIKAVLFSGNATSWQHWSVSTFINGGIGACIDIASSKTSLFKKGLIAAGVVGGVMTGGVGLLPGFFGGLSGYLMGETVDQLGECCKSRKSHSR